MSIIGDRLKEERLRSGWSQKDLAHKSKTNVDTISGIETGQHEPRPSTLRKLARALNIEVRDLFEEPTLAGKAEAPETGPLRREEILDVVHDAILGQETETQQAVNRTIESGQQQDSYVRHENELMARIWKTNRDVVAEALIETMRELVRRELVQQEQVKEKTRGELTAAPEPTKTGDS